MKKALVVLLALVCLSAAAFADTAVGSWHAWNQGNLFPYYQIGSASGSMGWGPIWDAMPGIDQEWTFSYDGNNYGFDATLEFGMDNFGNDALTGIAAISWFSTYYKFGDLLKVRIGKPRVSDYTEFSQLEGNNVAKRFGDSDFMAMLQLTPISGLSIAAALYVPAGAAAVNAAAGTPPDYAKNFGVAASYAVPDLLTVKVDYRDSEALVLGGAESKLLGVGLNVGAIKGLPINAGLSVDLSASSNMILKAFGSVGISMFAPLNVALDVFYKSIQAPSSSAYGAEVDVNMTFMAPWAVGLTLGYDTGSATGVVMNWFNQGVGDWTGFEFYPYVKASFDNGSSFKVGFVYATQDSTGASNTVIAVPIIYVWAF